jgi:cobalt/nickel transport system permease protein
LDIGYLDTFSGGTSAVHRLDPRAKLITTLGFIVAVVSFEKYALFALIPFCAFPGVLASASGLPARYLVKKVLMLLPVAAVIALSNPLFDRQVAVYIGPWGISGGWISFFSVLARFAVTVSAVLVLIATTGFNSVCLACRNWACRGRSSCNLLLLNRYIFVLMEEAGKMVRACALRSFDSGPWGCARSTRLSLPACARYRPFGAGLSCDAQPGFRRPYPDPADNEVRAKGNGITAGWLVVFVILLRWYNIPVLLGR